MSNMRYQCDQCEVSYVNEGDVKNHVKAIHEGNPDFQCEICFTKFNRRDTLRLHKSNIHGIGVSNKHICDKCDKSFTWSTDLRDHKLTKHKGIQFKCDLCEKVYSHYYTLKSHLDKYQDRVDVKPIIYITE